MKRTNKNHPNMTQVLVSSDSDPKTNRLRTGDNERLEKTFMK